VIGASLIRRDWMAAGHAFLHVLQVGEGLDVIELCSGDEGTDRRPAGHTAIGSCEEVVLSAERDRADGAFDGVGVEFDAAVINEAAKAAPVGQGIADGIGQAAARWDIRLAGCWAHARRKFYEVQQATGSPIATEALRRIAELYAVEAAIRGQTATVRQAMRDTESRAADRGDEGLARDPAYPHPTAQRPSRCHSLCRDPLEQPLLLPR
jgi:Transposase IS66 family